MTHPRISVVMPTHNRAALLPGTLRALGAQTVPPTEYEVILVADGCTDATPATVAAIRPALGYRLHFIEQAAAGAAAARNRGVEQAAAPLILFLDDDMDPAPTLVEAHLAEHAAQPGLLVLGYFPIPFGPVKDDPFARPARDWWDAGFAARRKAGYRFDFRDFCTGNISVPAALFREVGGFYQRIGGAGGEDWELGYRLLRRGARFRFAQRALSLHQDFNSLERTLRRSRAEGLAHAYTVQRHIELAWSFNLHRLSRLQALPFTPLWRFVWRHPAAADVVAGILKCGVESARRLGLESIMYRLHRGVAGHAYWRGVHAGFGSLGAWEQLMQDAPLEPGDTIEVDLDLASAPAELEFSLRDGADSARLWWRGSPVGRIPPRAGAEHLAAIHVRDEAIERFAGALVHNGPVPEEWRPLVSSAEPKGIACDAHRPRAERTCVAQFDLDAPDHLWGLQDCDSVQLLARAGRRPLAYLRLPLRAGTAVLSVRELVAELDLRGVRHDGSDAAGPPAAQAPVSVVVCAGDRPHALRRCLNALTRLKYGNFDVVVIDGSATRTETAQAVSETSFRYVREEQAGLDSCRNRGIAESPHEIIAFLDAGAVASPDWLDAIVAAFEDPAVSAVTGLTLPAELVFPAQHDFARYCAGHPALERRDLDGSRMTPAQQFAAPCACFSANMAFRRKALEGIGMFDPGLDVRSGSDVGGELDVLHRILVAGLTIRYEPGVLVWHTPWRNRAQLQNQLYADGRAFGVYLLKVLRTRSVPRRSALRYAMRVWLRGRLGRRGPAGTPDGERPPMQLAWAELRGALNALWVNGTAFGTKRRRRAASTLGSGLEA